MKAEAEKKQRRSDPNMRRANERYKKRYCQRTTARKVESVTLSARDRCYGNLPVVHPFPLLSAFCFLQSYLTSDTHRKPQVVVDSHTLFSTYNLVSVPSLIAACVRKFEEGFAAFQTNHLGRPEYQPPRDVDLSDASKMDQRGLSCCHCAQSTHVAFSEKCCVSGTAKVFGLLYVKYSS